MCRNFFIKKLLSQIDSTFLSVFKRSLHPLYKQNCTKVVPKRILTYVRCFVEKKANKFYLSISKWISLGNKNMVLSAFKSSSFEGMKVNARWSSLILKNIFKGNSQKIRAIQSIFFYPKSFQTFETSLLNSHDSPFQFISKNKTTYMLIFYENILFKEITTRSINSKKKWSFFLDIKNHHAGCIPLEQENFQLCIKKLFSW